MLCGAGLAVCVLGALTIGPFVAVPTVLLWLALVRSGGDRTGGVAGVLFGVGVLVLWVAWLNRHGPGEYCTSDASSRSCEEQWSPWPWALVGGLLVAWGAGVVVAVRRRGSPRLG